MDKYELKFLERALNYFINHMMKLFPVLP